MLFEVRVGANGRPQLFCKPRCRDAYYNHERHQLEMEDAQRSRADAEAETN